MRSVLSCAAAAPTDAGGAGAALAAPASVVVVVVVVVVEGEAEEEEDGGGHDAPITVRETCWRSSAGLNPQNWCAPTGSMMAAATASGSVLFVGRTKPNPLFAR
jgi:hypothetical protein